MHKFLLVLMLGLIVCVVPLSGMAGLQKNLGSLKERLINLKGRLTDLDKKLKDLKKKLERPERKCVVCEDFFPEVEFIGLNCKPGVIHDKVCRECLSARVDVAINDENLSNFICPELACRSRITRESYVKIAMDGKSYKDGVLPSGKNKASQMSAKQKIVMLDCLIGAANPNFRKCPNKGCNAYYLLGDKSGEVASGIIHICPECKKQYCSDCQEPVEQAKYEEEMNSQLAADPNAIINIGPHSGRTCVDIKAKIDEEIEATFPNTSQGVDDKNQAEYEFLTLQKCNICGQKSNKEGGCQVLENSLCGHHFCFGCRSFEHHVGACRNGYICYYTKRKVADWMEDGKLNVTIRFGKEVNLDFSKQYVIKEISRALEPGIGHGQYISEYTKYLTDNGLKLDSEIKVAFDIREFNGGIDVKIDVPEIRVTTNISKAQLQKLIDYANEYFNEGVGSLSTSLLPSWYKEIYHVG